MTNIKVFEPNHDLNANIAMFCQKWRIERLEVFGSVARGDARPDSDMDFLVTFARPIMWTLLDFINMQDELSAMVGRKAELVARDSVENSPNWIRRKSILESVQPLYA